jgi:hypothetical protein
MSLRRSERFGYQTAQPAPNYDFSTGRLTVIHFTLFVLDLDQA